MTIPTFQKTILSWHKRHRRDLPWRNTRDPYRILVSEIMLQQTQVSRVLIKYEEFLQAFPTINDLARAPEKKLLTIWSGMGYWRRAKFLKATAQAVIKDFNGKFPQDIPGLESLPGIGPYTAGAIACFAFNSTEAFIDTNIRRVYLHFFFPDKENISDKEILAIAAKAVYKKDPREWHYALFDYGATELKNKSINKHSKHYVKQNAFTGSFRSFRAQAIKKLLTEPENSLSKAVLLDFIGDAIRKEEKDYSPEEIIEALLKDELIKESDNAYFL